MRSAILLLQFRWSDYFTNLMDKANLHIPDWLTMDYVTAQQGFMKHQCNTNGAIQAWNDRCMEYMRPRSGTICGIHSMDLPALLIVALITYVVFGGIKESRSASNMMVILKLAVIFLIIVLGAFYINPDNWSSIYAKRFCRNHERSFRCILRLYRI